MNRALFVEDDEGHVYYGSRGAAGCIIMAQDTGRLMLGRRSENVTEPGTWGSLGGAIEEGSAPMQTAMYELFEETGYDGPVRLVPLAPFRTKDGSFCYHNFLAIVEKEFTPRLDHESGGAAWFDYGEWPQPLHFGIEHLLIDDASRKVIQDCVADAKRGKDFLKGSPSPPRTL